MHRMRSVLTYFGLDACYRVDRFFLCCLLGRGLDGMRGCHRHGAAASVSGAARLCVGFSERAVTAKALSENEIFTLSSHSPNHLFTLVVTVRIDE